MEADARGLPTFLNELRSAIAQLERFPWSGPVWRDGEAADQRALLVAPYLLVYAVSDTAVHLVRLHHVRRAPGEPDLTLLR